MSLLLRVSFFLLIFTVTASAKPMLHGGAHHEPAHDILAAKILGGASFDPEGIAHRRTGVAALYEHPFIPHWLEGEISVGAVLGEHGVFIPVELLLKIPFQLTQRWELYAGAGPAMLVDLDHEEAYFGAVVSVGSFLWLSEHFGLLFEIDYIPLYEHGAVHEIEGAVGVAWRI